MTDPKHTFKAHREAVCAISEQLKKLRTLLRALPSCDCGPHQYEMEENSADLLQHVNNALCSATELRAHLALCSMAFVEQCELLEKQHPGTVPHPHREGLN